MLRGSGGTSAKRPGTSRARRRQLPPQTSSGASRTSPRARIRGLRRSATPSSCCSSNFRESRRSCFGFV
eukprot:14972456-Alexandrium_andersonii.AAC.1